MIGRDFIVLSDTLGEFPTSSFHLFKNIAKTNRVFWFNILTRVPRLSQLDIFKVKSAIFSWLFPRRGKSRNSEFFGIRVFSPVMIPVFNSIFRKINCKLLAKKFANIQNKWQIRDPIFITTFPVAADFFKSVSTNSRIYYCVDDFLNYPGIHRQHWEEMENLLLQNVNGIIVTSKHLSSKCPSRLPLLHLPHGVDYSHFQRKNDGCRIIDKKPLQRPVVGFFGLVSEWVDLDLIAFLAKSFPAISFVIVGRSEVPLDKIRAIDNVFIIDHVPYNELPDIANVFDIGLIPFLRNELTNAVNPLKLLEYFALGLPVISTKLPELINYPGPIKLAETKEEFRAHLAVTLNELTQDDKASAKMIARQNSWESRVDDLYQFLLNVA